ncbi:hypothetical protein [Phormidium sp. FACHB-1136]|uniref:hypothetical protein n=1 Tax=Phormidium sp. FACHB-1136 TaxID=2692848 RepID=UPI001687E558|nr:hypothetical protein [Phormidium sp. FACHB-1136]MBD2427968.1 hypothetical protein [Phormidium sp. FACHB-1136]
MIHTPTYPAEFAIGQVVRVHLGYGPYEAPVTEQRWDAEAADWYYCLEGYDLEFAAYRIHPI